MMEKDNQILNGPEIKIIEGVEKEILNEDSGEIIKQVVHQNMKKEKKIKIKKEKKSIKDDNVKNKKNIFRAGIIKLIMNLFFVISGAIVVSIGMLSNIGINSNLNFVLVAISYITFVFSAVYIYITSGKNMYDENVCLMLVDKIAIEILILLEIVIGFSYVTIMHDLFQKVESDLIFNNLIVEDVIIVTATYTSLFLIATLIFIKPICKNVKNKTILKYSIIANVIRSLIWAFKTIYLRGNAYKRYIFTVLTMILLSTITRYGVYVAIVLSIVLAILFARECEKTKKIIVSSNDNEDEITKGPKYIDYVEILNGIDEIKNRTRNEIIKEIENERINMSLILDTIHDFNMPIDSIVISIEKLSETNSIDKETKKILDSIKNKALFIKSLGYDTIQKSNMLTSEVKIDIDKIDMFSFITKGLMEIEQDIKNSGISFKLNIRKQKISVKADKTMLWRIIQNLITDVYKHANKGARVFLEIDNDSDYATIIMKNETDKNNMSFEQFDRKYLMQANSITSLNVAKNLATIQKGKLSAEIKDGMFIVNVKIPLYKEN